MYSFAFLGTGNMGSSIARAVSGKISGKEIILADKNNEKAHKLSQELMCSFGEIEEAATAKYIFIGVKPNMLQCLFDEIKEVLRKRQDKFVLISMAAGVTIERIKSLSGGNYPVIRIMPNMPVAEGKGTTVFATSEEVTKEEIAFFENAMEKSGTVIPIEEKLIDAASAISGSGPAFSAMFIEALSDAGVKCGLSRNLAQILAAQTVIGTGVMVEKGYHPAVLKDMVSSPAGTTIEGVKVLEENAFRGAVISACEATYMKNKKM